MQFYCMEHFCLLGAILLPFAFLCIGKQTLLLGAFVLLGALFVVCLCKLNVGLRLWPSHFSCWLQVRMATGNESCLLIVVLHVCVLCSTLWYCFWHGLCCWCIVTAGVVVFYVVHVDVVPHLRVWDSFLTSAWTLSRGCCNQEYLSSTTGSAQGHPHCGNVFALAYVHMYVHLCRHRHVNPSWIHTSIDIDLSRACFHIQTHICMHMYAFYRNGWVNQRKWMMRSTRW